MDKKSFAEIKERLLEINKFIAKLDSSIKVPAFDFLKPYITGGVPPIPPADSNKAQPDHQPIGDVTELIAKYGDGEPSDNVKLLAALWFTEYGSNPFSLDYLRAKATETGLTVPTRLDKTLKVAKENGKALFASTARAQFKPTVVGGTFFKTTYNIRKGTRTPPAEK